MTHNRLRTALMVLCASLVPAIAAHASPITYVRYVNLNTSDFGERSSVGGPTQYDSATLDILADFGRNGIAASSRETTGVSAWIDDWTITGGSGVVAVNWTLDGTIALSAPPSVCTTCTIDPVTVQYRSLFGAPSVLSQGTVVDTITQAAAGVQSYDRSGTLFFNYVSGQTFTAGFRLSGGLGDDFYGGSLDFLNTASIASIVLSEGASLTTSSGAQYNVVTQASVPEPSTLLLLGSGLFIAIRRTRTYRS